jgi:single-strand DNA-binding protein
VEGALKTRKYTTQGGEDRYVTEIVVGRFDGEIKLGAGGKGNDKPDAKAPAKDNGNHGGADHAPGGDDNLDQDIPF